MMTERTVQHHSLLSKKELEEQVEEIAHLLPEQGPLHTFVHHNTLHAFEYQEFHSAAQTAALILGGEPYFSEERYQRCMKEGRITPADIDAILAKRRVEEDGRCIFEGGPTRESLQRTMLLNFVPSLTPPQVTWMMTEGRGLFEPYKNCDPQYPHQDALSEPQVALLWNVLIRHTPRVSLIMSLPRIRDCMIALGLPDTDLQVHPILIRYTSAYLDQGMSYWRFPYQGEGFLEAFFDLFQLKGFLSPPWLHDLRDTIRYHQECGHGAAEIALDCLRQFGVPREDAYLFLRETLLSLRGWAGMIRQCELFPKKMPRSAPPAKLMDYLALQLLLDLLATKYALRKSSIVSAGGSIYAAMKAAVRENQSSSGPIEDLGTVYRAFCIAQCMQLSHNELSSEENARSLLHEVQSFHEVKRRELLQEAYEFHYLAHVLTALVENKHEPVDEAPQSRIQTVFCIDDREESVRRHLEEASPDIQTFGYAGFFGIPMAFQGLDDRAPVPLCPIVVTPEHLVREIAEESGTRVGQCSKRKRFLAGGHHAYSVASRTLFRGALVVQFLGVFAVIPLIFRCLFPGYYRDLLSRIDETLLPKPRTRFLLKRRPEDKKGENGLYNGFSVEEMANIVRSLIETTGVKVDQRGVICTIGHGSSSLNNPHETTYDCGACGGGRGGPNARAFALMANDEEVRALLRLQGLAIHDECWFIGCYHNTCDDSLQSFDGEFIPDSLKDLAKEALDALRGACIRDAHERCRRFTLLEDSLSLEEALHAVEQHAHDLAEARPEYGHSTNAICIVGRRELSQGLFFDRRAFLVSYEPTRDTDGKVLTSLLGAVLPVVSGINLEYYFSTVDTARYGCGTKLPHNVTGLIGVMDGHSSDLRTGLPAQVVEIHEPMRLLTIVQASVDQILLIMEKNQQIAQLIQNEWIRFVCYNPENGRMDVYENGGFKIFSLVNYAPIAIPEASSSFAHYAHHHEHLPCATIGSQQRNTHAKSIPL